MKITKVELFLFHCDTTAPAKPVGIRMYTDEGIYGDGEASMSYGNGAEGAYGMLESLIPLVLGMNPLAKARYLVPAKTQSRKSSISLSL